MRIFHIFVGTVYRTPSNNIDITSLISAMSDVHLPNNLNDYLVNKFQKWTPAPPEVVSSSQRGVQLCWRQQQFRFLDSVMMYRLQRKEKVPQWVMVYSGGKTTKFIDNLCPGSPHQFRVQVVLGHVHKLTELALDHFGDRQQLCRALTTLGTGATGEHDVTDNEWSSDTRSPPRWICSKWSSCRWSATVSAGPASVVFSRVVSSGHVRQAREDLGRRPGLVDMVLTGWGLAPLALAAHNGDMKMVKLLLESGADLELCMVGGRRALHVALLGGHCEVAALLLDRGAQIQACDVAGLRAEHCAVDSGRADVVRLVMGRGGRGDVRDGRGWTPLFRAVVQGASSAVVHELVSRGSRQLEWDQAGLALSDVALLPVLGRRRASWEVRLLCPEVPRYTTTVRANYTRLARAARTLTLQCAQQGNTRNTVTK